MGKLITILGCAVVGGRVRHAWEGEILVTDRVAGRLTAAGVLTGDPIDAPDSDAAIDEPWLDEPAAELIDDNSNGIPDGFLGDDGEMPEPSAQPTAEEPAEPPAE